MLCESPELRCTRVALQDQLWSDREQAQGATSLRQALSEIRRSLGDYRDVLRADNRMVALDRGGVTIDIDDHAKVAAAIGRGLIYLDGIGVKDPEFEDWLRDRRLAHEDVAPAETPVFKVSKTVVVDARKPPLPILHLSALSDGGFAMFAEHVLHAVGKGVAEAGAVDVRFGFDAEPSDLFYLLEVGERALGEGTALHVRLRVMPGGSVCWQKSEVMTASDTANAGATLSRLINQCIDGTISAFGGMRPFGRLPPNDPAVTESAAVLHRMWSSVGSNPGALILELQESYDRYGRGIDLAWQAFIWCFVVGERRDSPQAKFDARRLITQAIELEPGNSLVLALASHIYGFVLREFEVALDLAERSIRLDRNNILGWAFLGVARVNVGQHEKGYQAAAYARRIAGEGPARDFVDGIVALTACMASRFDEAIKMGETINARRPVFAPPLRYLIASYLLAEDYERAHLTVHRLRELEPDFETRLLADPEYPVEPLRRSGLIDVRKVPLLT
ncbi:hypothetical protein [Paracoccus tegillarcae]|uniref:TolB-like protein n=1 Tax=Paracoccus tegillarcae TaxID=1529068 RepID=A0A2K9EKQ7_9RHOB|nr:hypothetical protein [Paracoccus tegillarcae]AUH35009.1 hypothetical protein CUV01_17960 [Paracoccus tegillarcae]